MKPAVCLLLTETHLHVVLFPFVDPKDPSTCLVNAIWLKPFTYKKNLFASLYLMILLMHKDFVCFMPLQVKFGVYRKGFQFVVTTIIDDRISRLEEKVKHKEENEKDMVKKMQL